MPKRVAIPEAVAPVDALVAPPPPSPIIAKLRTDWRWAAISQFIWTFSDAFNLPDWDVENLEADMDGDETEVIPELLAKLLFALTYNRQINRDNAFENLRKTYLKRAPDTTPLGTPEEPLEWAALGLSQKVQIIHQLCEWQMDNPARFRALLKTEDDEATWRVDPIGWDRAGNTYYLFDDNRLWVQRIPPSPPRPPKKTSLKAKRAERAIRKAKPAPKKSHKKKAGKPPASVSLSPPPPVEEEVVDGPRKRTQVAFYGNLTPTVAALRRGASTQATPQSSRGTRSSTRLQPESASKTSAEARPARTRGQATESPSKSRSTPLPLGTRVSRRLRDVDDEWQQIPDEWLADGKPGDDSTNGTASTGAQTNSRRHASSAKGKGRETDDESELSELTDEEAHQAKLKAALGNGMTGRRTWAKATPSVKAADGTEGSLTPPPEEVNAHATDDEEDDGKSHVSDLEDEQDDKKVKPEVVGEEEDEKEDLEDAEEEEEMDEVKFAVKKANELPEGFVEWEAVCVTLYDWRTFPEQFARSRDPDEKALYQTLAREVGPTIIETLVTKEIERQKQLAVNNRKRSSRIATKELEREEIMTRQRAQREMEERMTKQQREELREAREQAEAAAQEKAREDRFREREERAAAREEAAARKLIEEHEREEAESRKEEEKKRKREAREQAVARGNTKSAGNDPGERWELACEVCRKTGWNIDEDQDLVSCDDCGRWQHTECHDRLDASQGRPKRRWEDVDFQCQDCRRKAARKRQKLEVQSNGHGMSDVAPHAAALPRVVANPGLSGQNHQGPYPQYTPGPQHPQYPPPYPPQHPVQQAQYPARPAVPHPNQHPGHQYHQQPDPQPIQPHNQYPTHQSLQQYPPQQPHGTPLPGKYPGNSPSSRQSAHRPSQSPSGAHSQGLPSISPRAGPVAGSGIGNGSPQSHRPVLPSLQQVTGMSNGHRGPHPPPPAQGPMPPHPGGYSGHHGPPHYPHVGPAYRNSQHAPHAHPSQHPDLNAPSSMHAGPHPPGHHLPPHHHQPPHAPQYHLAPQHAPRPPNPAYPPASYPSNGHPAAGQPWPQGPPRHAQPSGGHAHQPVPGGGYGYSARPPPTPPGYAGNVRRD